MPLRELLERLRKASAGGGVSEDSRGTSVSNERHIYILVRYSETKVEIFGATAVFTRAQAFEKKHPGNRAVITRLEQIADAPLQPLNNWP
jgi:hypothetical protein